MALYAQALADDNAHRSTAAAGAPRAARPRRAAAHGYLAGCVGDVASLHARYYAPTSGFGQFFEAKVATELAAFVQALPSPSPSKGLWLYVERGRAQASIAIDGGSGEPGRAGGAAHLRWFIVDESLRGTGVGRRLLSAALDFADARFDSTYLWTFKALDAARHLYEAHGFELTDEAPGEQWGATVVEQRFCRTRPPHK
jgi:GNAT superfamily N-acetyltransferase